MSRAGVVVLVVVTGLVALAAAAGAWWAASGRFDRVVSVAQAAADRVAPGQVRVREARGLGAAGGYAVTGGLTDDPDAVVRFGVRSPGTSPSVDEQEIVRAVAAARADADELRALRAAFDGCGLPVVGVRALQRIDEAGGVAAGDAPAVRLTVSVVIAASADADGGVVLLARLDRCALAHAARRDALPRTAPGGTASVDVSVVDPGALAPPVADDRPGAQVLAEQAGAADPLLRHRTTVVATAAAVVEPAARAFGPARGPAPVDAALAVARAAAGSSLVNEPMLHAHRLYLPGSVSRVRAYATYRSTAATRGGDDRAVVLDVGVDGSDPVAVGVLDLPRPIPFEPGLR